MTNNYMECTRCLLSTSDYPEMEFNNEGVCIVCQTYDELKKRTIFKGEEGNKKTESLIQIIKKRGRNKPYDCIVGVSGGIDSTYVAFLAKQWGLKPLIVHIDNGWNSELAVKNIENVLKVLNFDLYTHVIKWEVMKKYQLAFLKSSVIDIDLPFDNTFMAILFQLARKHGIKYILSGHNIETEGWLPPNFTHFKLDTINIKSITKKYGEGKGKLELIGPLKLWFYQRLLGIKMVSLLNYIEYNKQDVKKIITEQLQWRDYGGKHFENIYTRFYQGYILPVKFKVNKNKAHLSTLICAGQLTKDEAVVLLKNDNYIGSPQFIEDKEFFIKKMGLNEKSFDSIMKAPTVNHNAFISYTIFIQWLVRNKRRIRKLLNRDI